MYIRKLYDCYHVYFTEKRQQQNIDELQLFKVDITTMVATNDSYQCWSLCPELAMVDGFSTDSQGTSHSDFPPGQEPADL